MPIVFIPNPNGGSLGTGLPIRWNMPDGPIPDGAIWRVIVFGEGGTVQTWLEAQRQATQGQTGAFWRPFLRDPGWSVTQNIGVPITGGQQAHAIVELESGGVVIDTSTTLSGTWDATSGLPIQIESGPAVSGGFNAQDRALLQATEQRSTLLGNPGELLIQSASGPVPITLAELFSRKALDLLTLDEVTSGETFDPVRASLALWFYGVIVRVTTIAEDLVAKTPDASWYFPDLAVLRVFRGSDLEYRRGIHTPTFMVEQPWQWGWGFLNENPILGVPPDISIAVDWRPGCGGQVFLQRLP